jgi:hypothetical protein
MSETASIDHHTMKKTIALFTAALVLLTSILQGQTKASDEKQMAAYLLIYFKDDTHSIHFALSSDGYSFTDVNNGQPVIRGQTIAE